MELRELTKNPSDEYLNGLVDRAIALAAQKKRGLRIHLNNRDGKGLSMNGNHRAVLFIDLPDSVPGRRLHHWPNLSGESEASRNGLDGPHELLFQLPPWFWVENPEANAAEAKSAGKLFCQRLRSAGKCLSTLMRVMQISSRRYQSLRR